MKHQIKQVFRSPKFVVGFVIFMLLLLYAIVYPMVSNIKDPLSYIGGMFYTPGKYVSAGEATEVETRKFNIDAKEARLKSRLSEEEAEEMATWLVNYGGIDEEEIDTSDRIALLGLWYANFDANADQPGLKLAEKKKYVRLNDKLKTVLNEEDVIIAEEDEAGYLIDKKHLKTTDYIRVDSVENSIYLPLGTDNFGSDVATKLASAMRTSLLIGLIAGLIATAIGLTLGLLAGYVGGTVDNFITFITNLFTVIPSFVILILIANSVAQAARGPSVVALIIGVTAWPWTCRSVRSQVISLRNRDHVNLSKLSGHSMPRIIVMDILPYVASYVVMALILQISSGILAEAQLSMLGLGPSTANTATLGLMLNWAMKFQAHIAGAWWAFLPVILAIAFISFSLNLMNTGLDQVFNPQLRDG